MPSIWSTVDVKPSNVPVVIPTKSGKPSHSEFIEEHIPEAKKGHYYTNKYFFGFGDLQTTLAAGDYDQEYPVWYGRRFFKWTDGAQISVDYAIQVNDNKKPANWDEDVKYIPDPSTPRLPKRTRILRPEEAVSLDDPESEVPFFINVHGLTGGSHENYVRAAICAAQKTTPGIECAVITTRGCNRTKITTPQLFNGAWTEDLRHFIKHVTTKQPKRPIFIAGYSLGGSILANYLGQESDKIPPQVKAAVVVCNPWDLLLCHVTITSRWIGRNIYQPQMTANLCRLAKNNAKEMEASPIFREQLPKLKGIKSVHQFDNLMTAPLFGFDGWQDYYRNGSSVNRLRDIRVPTLILAAKDDPICGDLCVPYEESPKNPYTHIVTTTQGGHLGWFSHSGDRWYATVLSKYLKAFVEDADLTAKAQPPANWKASKRWFREGRFQVEN